MAELNPSALPAAAASAAAVEGTSLLDSIIDASKVATSEQERAGARDLIRELVDQILDGTVTISKDLAASLDARIAQLDALMSAQLSSILHAPELQQLEVAATRADKAQPHGASAAANRRGRQRGRRKHELR